MTGNLKNSSAAIYRLCSDEYSHVLSFLPLGKVVEVSGLDTKTYACCQPIFKEQLDLGKKTFEKFLPIEKSFSDGRLKHSKKKLLEFLDFVKKEEPEFGSILKKNNLQFDRAKKEIYDENLIKYCKIANSSFLFTQNSFSAAKGDKKSFFSNWFPSGTTPDSISGEFVTIMYEELSKIPLSEINNVNTLRLIKNKTLSFVREKLATLKEKKKNEPLSEEENSLLNEIERLNDINISSRSYVSTLGLLLSNPPISKDEPILTLFPEEIFESNDISPTKNLLFERHHIHLIPKQLNELQQLEFINGSGNPIKKLPECIALPNLKTISFNGTLLEEIPPCLEKSKKLEELNFSYCQIDHFPGKWILNLSNLKKLDLRGNKIQNIPWEIYQELKKRGVAVDLSGNPLKINNRTLKIHAFEYLQHVKEHPIWHVGTTLITAVVCRFFFSPRFPIAAAASSSLLVWKGFEFLNQRTAKLFYDYFLGYKKE
jgi:Leucine-rich repeat (LRR) protein